ncbi:hypothetical protein [Sandaracinus amylolyticus]|uniref:hypothetical protein n=1 Tax=Sandaracinus amylolyticus TaxID=927083 RepID=UPI001F1EEBB3|nr:hypothetical protein [Sandaracinus amylolyticus]UJR79488.1 Hypothetical protein I5071_15240 [Sandaracinus amylolyticus]
MSEIPTPMSARFGQIEAMRGNFRAGSRVWRDGTESDKRATEMSGLLLLLAIGGVLPVPALLLPSAVLERAGEVSLDAGSLHLTLDLVAPAPSGLDDLGRTLGDGIALGDLRVGLDGVPGQPFVSNFLSEHEIRFTHLDPETVVSQVMVRVRMTLD